MRLDQDWIQTPKLIIVISSSLESKCADFQKKMLSYLEKD